MRAVPAILALSLAANAAWALTVAFSGSGPPAAVEPGAERPVDAQAPRAAPTGLEGSRGGAPAAKAAPTPKPYQPPWALASPPPALGAASTIGGYDYVKPPSAPEDRLVARLGRAPTSEESEALGKMTRDGATSAADHLAQQIAARRGRDEASAHGAGPMLDRLSKVSDAKKSADGIKELLDFIAGHDFEAAFSAGGYGPTIAWSGIESQRARVALTDGATFTIGAGEHELDFHAAEDAFEYRPFPRDITLAGAGPTKTLLRVRRAVRATGPVVNFTFSGMSVELESGDVIESDTRDPVSLRFVNCRISTGRGIELQSAGALWLDDCTVDGAWGGSGARPVVERAKEALVRFDRCVLTLSPPFESRSVLAAVVNLCNLREQGPLSDLTGDNVRLVETTVQPLATKEEWLQRIRVRREFTVDGDSTHRR